MVVETDGCDPQDRAFPRSLPSELPDASVPRRSIRFVGESCLFLKMRDWKQFTFYPRRLFLKPFMSISTLTPRGLPRTVYHINVRCIKIYGLWEVNHRRRVAVSCSWVGSINSRTRWIIFYALVLQTVKWLTMIWQVQTCLYCFYHLLKITIENKWQDSYSKNAIK